ncbi:acyl carrier protein [Streptomyces cyaneofuscatus]|uniref:acyl carrier protein n=1 Tax=Streptomyces cyaneofuscatus TaxID=66883 RepID=UPI0033BE8E6B
MSEFAVPELLRILRECAGADENLDFATEEVGATSFEELGYDSLALLETVARVENQLGVRLPEEDFGRVSTPDQFVALVKASLAAPAERG